MSLARPIFALLLAAAAGTGVEAKRLDVGGYRLRAIQKGRGAPVVVFDAGLGDSLEVWNEVWPEVARSTRVFLYDRAGLGRSDEGPRPRSSDRMVEELHTLLRKAGVEPPYVLVGHSLGGLNLRLYACLHPEDVAGLVLVDATPVGFPEEFERHEFARTRMEAMMATATPGAREEFESVRRSATAVREAGPIPGIPVIVLSSDRTGDGEEFRVLWSGLQREMAETLGAVEHRVVEGSGHYLQNDAPETVIRAIRRMLEIAR